MKLKKKLIKESKKQSQEIRQTGNKSAPKHGPVSKKKEAKTKKNRSLVKTKKKLMSDELDKDENDASCGAYADCRILKNGKCWIQCQLMERDNFMCITWLSVKHYLDISEDDSGPSNASDRPNAPRENIWTAPSQN